MIYIRKLQCPYKSSMKSVKKKTCSIFTLFQFYAEKNMYCKMLNQTELIK